MAQQKKHTVTELWQTARNWLQLLGIKANEKFCREEITTHPDYPALTALTDFLDAGNMRYDAVQADASYIQEFNYPLLAHIRQPGQQYLHIISNAAEWNRQKEITQHWSGIVVYPEEGAVWHNEQNARYLKEAFKTRVFTVLSITVALGLYIASALHQANIATAVFGLLSLVGLVISIFLLGAEIGYQNQLVKQVCGAVSSGGCEKVLKTKYAKSLLGITPADAAIFYFAAQYIFYLLSPYNAGFLNTLFSFSLAGIAIAAWSIYTQAIKVKEWCALCLGIVAVLVLQTSIALFFTGFQFSNLLTLQPVLFFTLLILILAIAILPVKALLKVNKTNQQQLAELKKWKNDAGLFITQWKQEQEVDATIWENDLLLGNPDAPVLITVACNPYCGPCARAHIQLDDMLNRFTGKLKVQIRLLCKANDEKDKKTVAVKAILKKAEACQSRIELQQILSDWFAWMDYEKWVAVWKQEDNTSSVERLQLHSKWIEQSDIQFTPTFFINGRKLPGRYNLNDVAILMPQLTEILTNKILK